MVIILIYLWQKKYFHNKFDDHVDIADHIVFLVLKDCHQSTEVMFYSNDTE